MSDNGSDSDSPRGQVVHGIHTQTAIFVAPDGQQFPYFQMQCVMEGGVEGPNILLNPALSIGVMGDIVAMLKTMFGVIDNAINTEQMDAPIDWDSMPPAPPEGNHGTDAG